MRRAAFWRVRESAANAMSDWLCGLTMKACATRNTKAMLFTPCEECDVAANGTGINDCHMPNILFALYNLRNT